MAFCYKPYVTADLYRIYESLKVFSTFSFLEFWNELVLTSSTPVARLYYYFIAKIGVPELLPAITCFIVYSCIFYIITKTAEKFSIERINIAIAVLFTMSVGNYMIVISNIRTMLAIALICWCFFRESIEEKYHLFHLLLYLMAGLLHNLAIVLIAFRIIVFLLQKRTARKKLFLIRISSIVIFGFASLYLQGLFLEVIEKAYEYLTGDLYSYKWEYIIGAIIYFVEVWLLLKMKNNKNTNKILLNDTNNYLILCLLSATIFFFEFSIFHRLVTYIAPILALPLLMQILNQNDKGNNSYYHVITTRTLVTAISLMLLFLTCFRGSICSLKFFII